MQKPRNFVAKHALINKGSTHRDRKNDYTRKSKHRNRVGDIV
jgi:hypothetical protein